jgi:hypothetical protein
MYYNRENISRIQHAIECLDNVEYYDWAEESCDISSELARKIQNCINELYNILEKAKKYERELYGFSERENPLL